MSIDKKFSLDYHKDVVYLFLERNNLLDIKPDLTNLTKILYSFSKIPYENISKILKLNEGKGELDRLRLPEELYINYLENNLGGTCYSLTYFLWSILYHTGFESFPLIMDMKWAEAAHCGLAINIENKYYLTDPGYLISNPIPIVQEKTVHFIDYNYTGVELQYNFESNQYFLYTFNKKERKFRYSFIFNPVSLEDFIFYWKNSFYQKSMRHICLTKVDLKNKGRIYIRNDFVRFYSEDKKENIKTNLENAAMKFFNINPEIIKYAKEILNGTSRNNSKS